MNVPLRLVFALGVLATGCVQPSLPLPEGEVTELDHFVIDELEADAAPGLQAAVFRDGEVTFQRSWGLADTDRRRRVTDDTLFMVASVSKLVVGVAVMQLVERGLLDLDEPISVHLPFSVRHPQHPSTSLTTRMLLAHTAAIRDNWDILETLYVDGDSPVGLGEFLAAYLSEGGAHYDGGRNFTASGPGQGYEYANIGNALAAHLVEVIDGRDFEAYCQAEIFEPLGMDRTSFRIDALDRDTVAVPTQWDRGWFPVGHFGWPDYPNGSLRTSATQLARFLMATTADGTLDGTRVLQAESVTEMQRVQYPELEPTQGLAFFWWTLDGVRVLGHDGGDEGVAAEVFARPDHGDGVLLLSNGELSEQAFVSIQRRLLQ